MKQWFEADEALAQLHQRYLSTRLRTQSCPEILFAFAYVIPWRDIAYRLIRAESVIAHAILCLRFTCENVK